MQSQKNGELELQNRSAEHLDVDEATGPTGNGHKPRKSAKLKPATKDVEAGPGRLSTQPAVQAATADEVRTLFLQGIVFKWARVTISGLSPLITNRAREAALRKMEDKQQGGARQKPEPRVPKQEFIESSHICKGRYDLKWLDKNIYGFPSVGVKKAVATAGYRFGDASNKVESLGSFFIHAPYDGLAVLHTTAPNPMRCVLKKGQKSDDDVLYATPIMRRDFVVIPSGKIGGIAYRPQFWPWSIELDIQYIPNFLSLEQIVNFLMIAGQCIGLGSWRIEKGGEKGRFDVTSVVDLPSNYQPQVLALDNDILQQG